MLRVVLIFAVSIIHFTISQATFSQYSIDPPTSPGIGLQKSEPTKEGTNYSTGHDVEFIPGANIAPPLIGKA